MSDVDKFRYRLERALARKKNNVASIKPIKATQANPVTGFDEELYQTTIISKMIKLIHKIQGVKQ